jgi:hypothetical protein
VVGSCEYDNEPSYSTKDEEFLDQLGDYQVLEKEPRSWESAGGQTSAPFQEF